MMAIVLAATSAIAVLFLGLPQVVLLLSGLQSRGWEQAAGAGVIDAIRVSFVSTLLSTLLTLTFGTSLAYILARWRFPWRRLITVMVELPIVLPPAVAGLALLLTLGRRGLFGPLLDIVGIEIPFTPAAVVLAETFVSAPFYIRAAQIAFQTVSSEIEDAARVDGASGIALFRRITLPLSANGLAAGLTLSWARALGEFGATIMFAGSIGGRTETMPLLVYKIFESNLDSSIWTSIILLGLAFMALLLSQWLNRQSEIQQ